MLDAERRATSAEPVVQQRRTGLIALIVIVILAAAGIGAWLLVRGGDKTATDVIQDLAKAMRNDDAALLSEVTGDAEDNWFLEWLIGLNLEPEFTDCTESTLGSLTRVSCTVTAGDRYFYSQVLDETITSSISGTVDEDGVFRGESWPPPAGLTSVEADLLAWVQENRPELEDQLWGSPGYEGIKMTRESGELRMQLLDDFKASLS